MKRNSFRLPAPNLDRRLRDTDVWYSRRKIPERGVITVGHRVTRLLRHVSDQTGALILVNWRVVLPD